MNTRALHKTMNPVDANPISTIGVDDVFPIDEARDDGCKIVLSCAKNGSVFAIVLGKIRVRLLLLNIFFITVPMMMIR
jgi:hypothetical protein